MDLGVRQVIRRGCSIELGSGGGPLGLCLVDHIDKRGRIDARPDRLWNRRSRASASVSRFLAASRARV
jgi:hypothetical protein